MQYQQVVEAVFLCRLNRFVAQVIVNGREETVHVKNTGRCRELLVPGCKVYLAAAQNPLRKTRYDLIAVEKQRSGQPPLLINMDSQIPNDAAAEWLRQGRDTPFSAHAQLRREVTYGDSRFDCYIEDGERRAFLEVKGVTLEQNGIAMFPDAPTERGIKHIHGLMDCVQAGYDGYILFVVQMKEITAFCPHDAMHPAFGAALRDAKAAGVQILARDCIVTPDSLLVDAPVRVML
ncbi:MAG: DNA/RNA nuclease SfsA [Oscillospiraceae bacterium]|nr:DNA/RNA nuclease SfsA [Oscillospiraceae bacterium]